MKIYTTWYARVALISCLFIMQAHATKLEVINKLNSAITITYFPWQVFKSEFAEDTVVKYDKKDLISKPIPLGKSLWNRSTTITAYNSGVIQISNGSTSKAWRLRDIEGAKNVTCTITGVNDKPTLSKKDAWLDAVNSITYQTEEEAAAEQAKQNKSYEKQREEQRPKGQPRTMYNPY